MDTYEELMPLFEEIDKLKKLLPEQNTDDLVKAHMLCGKLNEFRDALCKELKNRFVNYDGN